MCYQKGQDLADKIDVETTCFQSRTAEDFHQPLAESRLARLELDGFWSSAHQSMSCAKEICVIPTVIHQDIIKYGYHKSEKRIIVKKFYDCVYPAAFHDTGSIFICGICEMVVPSRHAKSCQ